MPTASKKRLGKGQARLANFKGPSTLSNKGKIAVAKEAAKNLMKGTMEENRAKLKKMRAAQCPDCE